MGVDYQTSNQPYRNCDKRSGFATNWYRFSFDGLDARIPTKVAPSRYRDNGKTCRTYTTAWMDGRLPAVGEAPETVSMKFTRGSGSNRDTVEAMVVACVDEKAGSQYYLYHLTEPDECDLAYCATTEFDGGEEGSGE